MHYLTWVERQEHAAIVVAPDAGDRAAIGVENRLARPPSASEPLQDGGHRRIERDVRKQGAVAELILAEPVLRPDPS
jgi:hypothetical protein